MGLMSADTDGGSVVIDQGLGNILPPRGLTISDGHMFSDKENLVSLAQSNLVETASFYHLELTLTRAVSVTIPHLLEGVTGVWSTLGNSGAISQAISRPIGITKPQVRLPHPEPPYGLWRQQVP